MPSLTRRELLTATLAGLAGAACTRAPREEIVPYVVQPPEVHPGRARYYATTWTLDGYATGLLVESHEGRPTKIEGNPAHPASLGATGVFEQASILSLYDPERAHGDTFERVVARLNAGRWRTSAGERLFVVLPPTSSPTLLALVAALRERFPRATVSFYSAGTNSNAWEGTRLAFGRVVEPRFDLSRADVVVALDSDFLTRGPQALVLARQFADRRIPPAMNRLYSVEPIPTVTGMASDHRLAVRASEVLGIAAAIAVEIGVFDVPVATPHRAFARAVARDLAAHPKRGALVVGPEQPPLVHAIAHAIDEALGNVGSTVTFAPSVIAEAGERSHGLPDLHDVDTLVFAGVNVVYTAPEIAPLVARARESVSLSPFHDETSRVTKLSLAEAHFLEAWGDARAFDGTTSVVQPLIEPMHGGRTAIELLAALADVRASARDLVAERFAGARDFRAALRRGVVEGTSLATTTVTVDRAAIAARLARETKSPPHDLELVARIDPRVHDGRFADNAWLLELPRPLTSVTWSNAAELSATTARALDIADGDEVEVHAGDRSVRAAACIVPGQADGTVGLTLGWGRGRDRGANAYALGEGAIRVSKTGRRRELPRTQEHHSLEGRDDVITSGKSKKRSLTLYENRPSAPKQWAMAIDLSRCTGCGACVVACQAENNVPAVGPEDVALGRAMHWLRIDTYVGEDERVVAQPMLCQHCEKAPCEYVCPVNATVHSPDGLNEMVYNRCVGTRFCSNNCPYKVRRFNWFDYHRTEDAIARLAHNPDVTVRERGVMEKCTFCVQRIREHEIHGGPLRTACEQACASKAIVFGDLRDRASEVARLQADERSFAALEELGTEPRVRYLARLRNANEEIG